MHTFEFNGQYYIEHRRGDGCTPVTRNDVISKLQHADRLIDHGRDVDGGFILFNGNPDVISEDDVISVFQIYC